MINYWDKLPIDIQELIIDKKVKNEIDDEMESRKKDYNKATMIELRCAIQKKYEKIAKENKDFSIFKHKQVYINVAMDLDVEIKLSKSKCEKINKNILKENEKLIKFLNNEEL